MHLYLYVLHSCDKSFTDIARESAYLRPDKHANALIPDLCLSMWVGPHKKQPSLVLVKILWKIF